jgi:hypothetical protein
MKILSVILCSAGLILAAGCSTLGSRITQSQEEFNSWPTEVQDKILAGQVDFGFTPAQVFVALGEPQRKYTRSTEQGMSEVWAYTGGGSGFSIGLGLGTGRGSTSYGGGVAYDTSRRGSDDERLRIVFQDGRVTSLESRVR